jgi:hypothetical protein
MKGSFKIPHYIKFEYTHLNCAPKINSIFCFHEESKVVLCD